jgi:hypothetical protein
MKLKVKHHILFSFLILLTVILLIDAIFGIFSKPVLQGFFSNDIENCFPAAKLEKEYEEYIGEKRRNRIVFEDGIYIEPGSSKDYTTASASKTVAYIAANELDFFVGPEDIVRHYQTGVAFEDIRNYLPEGEFELLYGKDGNGEEKALAVSLKNSRFLKDKTPKSDFYLFIPSKSRRKENVKPFLEWAFN